MSRRIDIELTSALPDDSWTWRAAGAKQPKGTLDGSILAPGASVGDVIKVEIDQEIDGITVRSVVGGRAKQERTDLLELLPTDSEFQPVIETRAKRDRRDRQRDDRGGRRGRGDRGRRDQRDDDDRRGDRNRNDRNRGGRGRRGGPSFTPPPEVPQRPKPKRLKPGKQHRNDVLAEIPEEQRPIAEVALQGMGAVRQRLREENERAEAEGRSPMPEASVIKMAEDLLPRLRVAEWRDRAEAAQRQMDHLDLRDLRSVVAAAGDPAVARDESTSALAAELTEALATKQEQETVLWFGDVDAALAVGRVIRALRLSSQPPKAGVPFPSDIAQRLVDSTNASLAPIDSSDRWIAVLEAAAFSPIRTSVAPTQQPDVVTDELLATVQRLGPALPRVAELFEVEVDPKAPMPKPLRQGPRKGGKGAAKSGTKGAQGSERPPRKGRGKRRPDREERPGPDDGASGRSGSATDEPASGGDAAAEQPSGTADATADTAPADTADATAVSEPADAGTDTQTDATAEPEPEATSTRAPTDAAVATAETPPTDDGTSDTAGSEEASDSAEAPTGSARSDGAV